MNKGETSEKAGERLRKDREARWGKSRSGGTTWGQDRLEEELESGGSLVVDWTFTLWMMGVGALILPGTALGISDTLG